MSRAERLRRSHPINVEPDPPNKSTTMSPALVLFSSARSINSTGFIVGCSRLAAGLFSPQASAPALHIQLLHRLRTENLDAGGERDRCNFEMI